MSEYFSTTAVEVVEVPMVEVPLVEAAERPDHRLRRWIEPNRAHRPPSFEGLTAQPMGCYEML